MSSFTPSGEAECRSRLSLWARSTRFPQDIFYRLGVLGDHREQHPPLLSVAESSRRESEFRGELRLTEAHRGADRTHIDPGTCTSRHADVVILTTRPRDGLPESRDAALAHGVALARAGRSVQLC